MRNYSELVLTKEDFGECLYSILADALKILIKGGYECQIYEDDTDIIVIRYNYSPRLGIGNDTIFWLSPEEEERLLEIEESEVQDKINDSITWLSQCEELFDDK